MDQVVIIDDEMRVRRGIQTLIDWEAEGFSICADAGDGIEGLEKIMEFRPDLVLVDIKMPGRNGIEVIREARKQGFSGQFIILTGFSEFEFAQSAVSLGVKAYLLKPIDEDELLQIIRDIRTQIDEQKEKRSYHVRNEQTARKELLRRILFNMEPRENMEREIALYQMQLDCGTLCTAVCQEETGMQYGEGGQMMEKVEYLVRQDPSCFDQIPTDSGIVLIGRNVDYRRWAERLERNVQKVREKYGASLRIAVGFDVCHWQDICYSYEFARYLLENRFLFGRKEILSAELLKESEESGENISVEYLEMMLEIGEIESIRRCVQRFRDYCTVHLMKESEVKIQVLHNLMLLKNRLSSKYGQEKFSDQVLQSAMEQIMETNDLEELLKQYLAILEELFWKIGVGSSETVIKRVYYYMEKNYAKDLKMESLAKLFHYNTAYLGKLFRQEMGENFNNMLDIIRITNARRLLAETDLKVYQISERVGYGNLDYFYQKFRKYVGISAKEYRKSLLAEREEGREDTSGKA